MASSGTELVIVAIVFGIIAWIFVLLRCLVRFRIVKSFGWDDWLIVLSMILTTLCAALLAASVHYGSGRLHVEDMSMYQLTHALKYEIISQPFYVLSTLFIKLSVGILLLRIAADPIYRSIIWGSMGVMTVWSATTFIVILLQCRPLSIRWNPNWKPGDGGKCMNVTAFTNFGYAFSAMDIFFDWVFALIPIPMLRSLQMSMQIKISLILVLGLGAFASTTTLVRLQYLVAEKSADDFIFEIARPEIWTLLELNLGIAAACMATLRPLFRNFHVPGFSSGISKSRRRTDTQTAGQRSYGLSYVGQQGGNVKSSAASTRNFVKLGETNNSHTSQESIIEHNGIQKRVDVNIAFEA